MVHGEGLEPTRLAAKEPKSFVSAISPAVHDTRNINAESEKIKSLRHIVIKKIKAC